MDAPFLLSLAALAVSILAALYARWAALEAKKANQLTQIEKRVEIYRAFDTLRFAMLRDACDISHKETSILYQPSRESEFHFPRPIAEKLKKYHKVCFNLAEVNRKSKRSDLSEGDINDIHAKQDQLLDEEAALADELDKDIRKQIKTVI